MSIPRTGVVYSLSTHNVFCLAYTYEDVMRPCYSAEVQGVMLLLTNSDRTVVGFQYCTTSLIIFGP